MSVRFLACSQNRGEPVQHWNVHHLPKNCCPRTIRGYIVFWLDIWILNQPQTQDVWVHHSVACVDFVQAPICTITLQFVQSRSFSTEYRNCEPATLEDHLGKIRACGDCRPSITDHKLPCIGYHWCTKLTLIGDGSNVFWWDYLVETFAHNVLPESQGPATTNFLVFYGILHATKHWKICSENSNELLCWERVVHNIGLWWQLSFLTIV